MDNLNRLKLYLNIPLTDHSQNDLLELLIDDALDELAAYTNRPRTELEETPVAVAAAAKLAVVAYNRRGTEGMSSQRFAGSNESYIDGLSKEVKAQINTLRLAKLR